MIPTSAAIKEAFGLAGSVAVRRRLGSTPVTFYVDMEQAEVTRRTESGLGAIVDRQVINALWEVPRDLDFPRDALPAWVVERLKAVDVVEIGPTVRRSVRPPLTIRGAAVVGRALPRLLSAVGPLSSVCATAIVLTSAAPSSTDPTLMDARLFGVAVGHVTADGIQVLSDSQAIRSDVGAYQWHLAELLYSEIAEVS